MGKFYLYVLVFRIDSRFSYDSWLPTMKLCRICLQNWLKIILVQCQHVEFNAYINLLTLTSDTKTKGRVRLLSEHETYMYYRHHKLKNLLPTYRISSDLRQLVLYNLTILCIILSTQQKSCKNHTYIGCENRFHKHQESYRTVRLLVCLFSQICDNKNQLLLYVTGESLSYLHIPTSLTSVTELKKVLLKVNI